MEGIGFNNFSRISSYEMYKECQTCASRTYVDGSSDASVSFKSPTHVSPGASAAAVMSHEQEHISNAQAKAKAEGKRVVMQSVQIYTAQCPECGKTYTAGGKATTVTASEADSPTVSLRDLSDPVGQMFDSRA